MKSREKEIAEFEAKQEKIKASLEFYQGVHKPNTKTSTMKTILTNQSDWSAISVLSGRPRETKGKDFPISVLSREEINVGDLIAAVYNPIYGVVEILDHHKEAKGDWEGIKDGLIGRGWRNILYFNTHRSSITLTKCY